MGTSGARKIKWTSEMDALLGTLIDRELAQHLGICKRSVCRRRLALGIPSWQSQHPADKSVSNRRHLLRKYGLTPEGYNAMLKAQGGKCAICGMIPGENGRWLDVDHDHDTGEVRGLLCSTCNKGLGMFQDHLNLLLRAVEYLN